jgi:glycosyltransferase involved in cell wall biosynthesis
MIKKYHIIYLSYDGLTDPLGQSQILPYIYGLNKSSRLKFTIISFEKLKRIEKLEKELSNNNINWHHLRYTKKPPLLSTIWDIYKLKTLLLKIIKKDAVNLIHSRSYITSLVSLALKKKYKIPFIFDMRGFYADERVDGKIWDLNSFIYRIIYKYFKVKEKEFMRFSNHIISLTNSGKKEIESWNLPNQAPITIIPCCTDANLFQRKNIFYLRKELAIKPEDLVISYVGSIGTWYMLDEMLLFFKALILKKKHAKFLLITREDPEKIYLKAAEFNINNESIIVQSSDREMMPSYIGVSDFSIFFILPAYSKKASSPTKMGEIMNLGIPIICNSGVGDVDEIMGNILPKLLVNDFNNKEYNRVIDFILNEFKLDSKKIIQISHNYYSLNKGVNKYLDIYNKILN